MRKTLSILLSLLMVLSTVTCLFTMPASAEEATTETTVETLPVNDFVKVNAVQTIKPNTVVKISGIEFPTSVRYEINGWNAVQSDSYIDRNVYYQMTFDVTVSEDINDGVTLRPVFHCNNDMNQTFAGIVGMRTDVTTPTVVETAYNLKTNVTSTGSSTTPTTTAANAATLVAGKTYTYTYIFNTYSNSINYIRMMAEGLTAGSVTVGEVKLFPRSETFANNFYFTTSVVSYAVEEDGNVFTRMYAYRDIGNTSTGHKTLSAKVGGELYNINLEGGKTYQLKFDARYKSEKGFHNSDTSGRSPGFNFYETGALLYNTAYASIRNEADTSFSYDKESAKTTSQRSYLGGTNAYSYFYADSGSTTINRRIKNNIANMSYYNADGTIINTMTQGYGSQSGRNFTDEINTGSWIKGVYSLDAIGEQSLQEAAIAGSASDDDAYMRYRYKNGAWVFNSAVNSYYAPAAQDVTVALGIEYLQAGSAYDFDNFELVSDVKDVPVEYVDKNGDVVITAYTAHPASSYYDVFADKTYASVELFESDVYTFNGWYNGDTFISDNTDLVLNGTYDDLKVVITTKNILTNAGGFENYDANTSLEGAYVEVSKGCAKYPNATNGTPFRYYTPAAPSSDKWTGWGSDTTPSTIYDNDSGATKAQIIEDIKNAGGMVTTSGANALTWFKNFPTVVEAKNAPTYADAGKAYGKADHYVAPYSGTKMLQMQASTRTGYRAIEGLTPGRTYTLSFYAYNPYAYYFLKDVAIKTAPYYGVNDNDAAKRLAFYTTPYTTVTEDIHNADGSVATTGAANIQKANADYVGKWYNISLTFKAEGTVAYLALSNQYKDFTEGFAYIDELTLVAYDCNGNHSYDGLTDAECNNCGEAKVYPTAWDFEDGNTENIGYTAAEVTVKDAENQPEKIGSKYLEYKTTDWGGMVFSFPYEQGYKYKISYDFKVFDFGGDDYVDADGYYQINANGLDHTIAKDADGKYNDNSYLATDTSAKIFTVTRYTEDGAVLNSEYFSNKKTNFYGRIATPTGETAKDKNGNSNELKKYGEFSVDPEVWETWQHFEVEIDHTATDYEGLIEYGFRPNGSGWVVGIDNFKVEKVSAETLNKVNTATNGTYAFNIRKQTAEKKQGLRFKSTIDLSASVAGEYTIVEYGTLAAKSTVLGKNGVLTLEMAEANKAVKGVAYNTEGTDIRYAEDGNIITYTGVLTGIGVKNYDVDFTVRAYAIVETADGTRTTVYDDVITLSVYKAALAIADPAVEEKEEGDKDIANEIIDAYYAYLDSAEQ